MSLHSPGRNHLDADRVVKLFLRLLVLTTAFLVPLILYTETKRNFAFVKFMTLRYLIFLALLVWLVTARRWWRSLSSPARAPWLVFLFGAILSCFCAPNLTECFDVHHVPDIVAFFVFFQLVFFFARSRRFIHLSMVLVVVQLTLASAYGLMQDLGIDQLGLERLGLGRLYFPVKNQAVSTMGNINFAGEYQVAAFPLVLAMVLSARKRWAVVVFALAAVLADCTFVSQDTEGSNLGFFFAILIMVPLGIWVCRRRAKLLLFFTAGGFAIEGVYTVFRDWWSKSYAYLLAIRNPGVVSVRGLDWDQIAGSDMFTILFRRYLQGKEAFMEGWVGMASDIWIALALGGIVLFYYYGIPAVAKALQGNGGSLTEWITRARKATLAAIAVALVLMLVVGGPIYVHRSINKTNEYLQNGGRLRVLHYAEVQPDAEHPYTLGHFFLDKVFSQWTYVFRLECWQAASANLWANSVPVLLGIGRGNFKVTHPLFASQLERKLLGAEVLARKVHNEWLATALEAGFFGIFGQLWLFVVFFYCGYLVARRLRAQYVAHSSWGGERFEYYFTLAAIGSLVGTSFHNSVSSNLLQPSSAVVTYWVAACLCGLAFPRRTQGIEVE
jgi:hypothetical protein